jgi:hypothetical protein
MQTYTCVSVHMRHVYKDMLTPCRQTHVL